MSEPLMLFHFTALLHLPEIMVEGITKGELPLDSTGPVPNAVNLTRSDKPKNQHHWAKGIAFDKTRVRIAVALDRSQVISFKEFRQQYKLSSKHIKRLAPGNQHFDWYYSLNGIPREAFRSVDVMNGDGEYDQLSVEQIQELCHLVLNERQQLGLEEIRDPRTGLVYIKTNSEESDKSWLFDGTE